MTIASGNKALAADALKSLNASGYLQLADLTATTIASGAITVTKNWYSVDTEGAAASDDLDTITAGSDVNDGHLLVLRPASDARTVVVKHGTGNIKTFGGVDISLDDAADLAMFIYDSANSKWLCFNTGTLLADGITLQASAGTLSVVSGGITATQLASNAVTTAKILDANVTTAKILDGNVTTAKLATDAVDDTIAGNRVARVVRRQGGSVTSWLVPGTTDYTPTGVLIQCGMAAITVFDTDYVGSTTITLPVTYSQIPLVFVSLSTYGVYYQTGYKVLVGGSSGSSITLTAIFESVVSGNKTANVSWMTIGPE